MIYIHTQIQTHKHMYVHKYTYIYLYTHTNIYTHTHIFSLTILHTHMHIYRYELDMIIHSTKEKTEAQEAKDLTHLFIRTRFQTKMSGSWALHHYANVSFTLSYNNVFPSVESGNLNPSSCSMNYVTLDNIYIFFLAQFCQRENLDSCTMEMLLISYLSMHLSI